MTMITDATDDYERLPEMSGTAVWPKGR